MSDTRLDELGKKLEAATAGEWVMDPRDKCGVYDKNGVPLFDCFDATDAAFIAAAKNNMAWLLERARRAEQLERVVRSVPHTSACFDDWSNWRKVRDAALSTAERHAEQEQEKA